MSSKVPEIGDDGELPGAQNWLDGRYRSALLVTPSMSQAAIQSALNDLSAGDAVRFKGKGGAYGLTSPLTLPADGILVDAEDATIVQNAWGVPAFDLIGRNAITLDLGDVEFGGTRGGVGSTYRGSSQYVSGAAVWLNGDRNQVRHLHAVGMAVGVFLSSWNGSSSTDRVGVGNRLGQVEVEGSNFGLLYVGQQDLVIDDLYAHDDHDDSGGTNPTHVIYCSATTSFRSSGGQFKSLRGKNILTGQPFQVKYHDGLTIDSMVAVNSKGFLNVIDSNDLSVGRGTSLGTLFNDNQGAITFQSTNQYSQRPKLGPIYIQQAASVDERVVNILADYGEFDRLSIDSNHSAAANPATMGEILVRGTGNRLRRPTIRSLGAGSIPGIWVGFSSAANNTVVEQPSVSGTTNIGKVDSASTGVVFDFDSAKQAYTGTSAIDTAGGNSYASTTQPPLTLSTFGEHAVLALLAGSGTPTVGAANTALQVRVTPRRNITVSSLNWWSVAPSGNYDIGIVDDATNAVLWSKGSTAWPAAGKVTEAVPSIKLIAGRTYRLVFSADNITGTLRGNQAPIVGTDLRLDGSTVATAASSAFPIPTPTLAAGGAGSTTRTPLIVVGGS